MWCGRKKFLNRSDYSAGWEKRSEEKRNSEDVPKKDKQSSCEFKISLVAMTSPVNFATLQEQFESLKE